MKFLAFVLAFVAAATSSASAQTVTGVDLERLDISRDDLNRAARVDPGKIESGRVRVNGANTFYRRLNAADVPGGGPGAVKTLFLLHGAIYSSDTWVRTLPTMQTMAAAGFDVVAVDLPGSANSRGERVDRGVSRSAYVSNLISELAPGRRVVLVSPSMSGGWAIPVVVENTKIVCGYVPVAPSIPGKYRDEQYPKTLPVMAVVGERDGKSSTDTMVRVMPNSQKVVIPEGVHAAYRTNPGLWHKLLYNFMNVLQC